MKSCCSGRIPVPNIRKGKEIEMSDPAFNAALSMFRSQWPRMSFSTSLSGENKRRAIGMRGEPPKIPLEAVIDAEDLQPEKCIQCSLASTCNGIDFCAFELE